MSTDGAGSSGHPAHTGEDPDRTAKGCIRPGDTRRAAVIVVDTSAARGDAADDGGPMLVDWLRASGYECLPPLLVEDGGAVDEVLRRVLGVTDDAAGQSRPGPGEVSTAAPVGEPTAGSGAAPTPGALPCLVVTSGGTGLNPLDLTPQVTAALLDFQTPGVMHALWAAGLQSTPTAVMSQGVAGVRGSTFVVNLPGSTGGVRDGISVLTPLLPHIRDQLADCAAEPPR